MSYTIYDGPARLHSFMRGLAAAVQLAQRAGENLFPIEFTILSASIIDAQLRIGLVLRHQLDTKTSEILEDLLFQSDESKKISEREVYERARQKGIITEGVFADLGSLYTQRNRVVHRYIISDITTDEVLGIGIQYELIRTIVNEAIEKLEKEQVASGVGMTRITTSSEADLSKDIDGFASTKHRNPALIQALREKKKD